MCIPRNRMSQARQVPEKIMKTINIKIYVIIVYNFNLKSLKHEQIDFLKKPLRLLIENVKIMLIIEL